ncbi:MAG: GNAT family N-acetyltransferase, partial [Bacteroidota bacterium]
LYPKEFKPFDQAAIESAFLKMLTAPNTFAFIAKEGETAIGYLFCFIRTRKENAFQFEKTWLNIDQVSVMPEYRNRGVAQQLLQRAEQLAHNKGIQRLQLDHWAQNEVAAQFFARNGFSYFNHRMEKKLKAV